MDRERVHPRAGSGVRMGRKWDEHMRMGGAGLSCQYHAILNASSAILYQVDELARLTATLGAIIVQSELEIII